MFGGMPEPDAAGRGAHVAIRHNCCGSKPQAVSSQGVELGVCCKSSGISTREWVGCRRFQRGIDLIALAHPRNRSCRMPMVDQWLTGFLREQRRRGKGNHRGDDRRDTQASLYSEPQLRRKTKRAKTTKTPHFCQGCPLFAFCFHFVSQML